MKIQFATEAESKRQKQEAFLKLSPGERVLKFFELMAEIQKFPTHKSDQENENFAIYKKM